MRTFFRYFSLLIIFVIPLDVSSTIYSVLSVPEDLTECVTSMAATLKFTVKDCDPATGEPDSDEVSLTLRGQSQEP